MSNGAGEPQTFPGRTLMTQGLGLKLTSPRFCEQVLEEKDAMLAYKSITFRAVYNFLDWLLNQTRGKHQQRKKGVRSKNSLITSWCVFRLAFERARNIKIDEVIDRRRLSNVRPPIPMLASQPRAHALLTGPRGAGHQA